MPRDGVKQEKQMREGDITSFLNPTLEAVAHQLRIIYHVEEHLPLALCFVCPCPLLVTLALPQLFSSPLHPHLPTNKSPTTSSIQATNSERCPFEMHLMEMAIIADMPKQSTGTPHLGQRANW